MERRGRMEKRKQDELFQADCLASHLRDADLPVEQRLRRPIPQRADERRSDYFNLLQQERLARLDFVRFRIAVVRRPAFDDIRNVDLRSRQAGGLQEFVEQLSRRANERLTLLILVESRRFSDEHYRGVWIADAED